MLSSHINWFKQLQMRSKILLGIGSLFVFGLLMILAFYFALSITDSALESVANQEQPTSAAGYEMEISVVRSGLEVLNYIRTGDSESKRKALL